jgi:hypothetical protein
LGVVVAAAVAVMASKITLITAHHLMYNVYASFEHQSRSALCLVVTTATHCRNSADRKVLHVTGIHYYAVEKPKRFATLHCLYPPSSAHALGFNGQVLSQASD